MERTEEEVLLSLIDPFLAPAVRKIIAERDYCKHLITQVLFLLPQDRDWLDPDVEAGMKTMCK